VREIGTALLGGHEEEHGGGHEDAHEEGKLSDLTPGNKTVVGYFVIGWPALRDFFLQYPWAIVLTFLINIGLGKWSGLRLVELFRFRHILKQES
jgi:hypothetical protein